jgi:hypothetical protein
MASIERGVRIQRPFEARMRGTMRGVFVVGMHSGGTSTATLALLGLGLNGPADSLQVNPKGHPRGIAESASMMELNNKLLASFGTTSAAGGRANSPPLPPRWAEDPRAMACRGEATSALAGAYPLEPWAYKDPRLCILLPFWRLVVGDDCAALLIIRHPVACARSLELRNRLPVQEGLSMWTYHLESAVAGLAGMPVLVTSYEAATNHPGSWCESAAAWLVGLGMADAPGRVAEAQKEILAEARHQTAGPSDDSLLIDGQARLYNFLLEAAGSHPAWPA